MSGNEATVKAKKIRSDCQDGLGDFIPGLDSAYVYDLDDDKEQGVVSMILHDADGDEIHLSCHRDMPITIRRAS